MIGLFSKLALSCLAFVLCGQQQNLHLVNGAIIVRADSATPWAVATRCRGRGVLFLDKIIVE